MKIAVFENIMTAGGHEVDFDRILVEDFQARGHSVNFIVPNNFKFQFNYKVPVKKLSGNAVTYDKSGGFIKMFTAAKREINRLRWYRQLYKMRSDFDVLIVPTSTYRYLRSLNRSILRNIDKPLIFILHGINPNEADKFLNEAQKLLPYKNVRLVVLTFSDNIFGRRLDNIFTIYPPTYTARDINGKSSRMLSNKPPDVLTIGFFGQYRREKRLEDFLNVFINGQYSRSVKLIVQGSTMHEEDAAEFERIIKNYSEHKNIEFMHKGLIGADWQTAIKKVDALLMPYSAPRYKYHWGGMLFTAIGFQKPVIASDDMNPEVFEMFQIGETFKSGNLNALNAVLEHFINNFDENIDVYANNLKSAAEMFSPENFVKRLEAIIES